MNENGLPAIGRELLVALTTPFREDEGIDREAFVSHARWLRAEGIPGVIVGGSLGEGAALTAAERVELVSTLASALPRNSMLLAAVGASRTSDAVELAREAAAAGATGLLVLPPYVYRGDRRETRAHFARVFRATELPCMLYNNPPAYGTDVSPEELVDLAAARPNLVAVKESGGDAGRIAEVRSVLGDRLDVAVGVDDAIVDGVAAGATGWVAGLANALPAESLALFDACRRKDASAATALFEWFRPLLRFDAEPKFVQLIKLVESECRVGTTRVRAPRLELDGPERREALATIHERLDRRPAVRSEPGR